MSSAALFSNQETINEKSVSILDSKESFFSCFIAEGDDDPINMDFMPCRIDCVGGCICTQGNAEVIIDTKTYLVQKGDLYVVFPNTILRTVRKSSDFQGYIISATKEFLYNINIPDSTNIYLYIKENPCVSLQETEQKNILNFYEMLKIYEKNREHPYHKEIASSLLMTIFYEAVSIYGKGHPIQHQPYSHKHRLFQQYQDLVAMHCHEQRDSLFYAKKLGISTRYLSIVTKEISGMTATECIMHIVLINARTLLASTDLPVKQISDKLNFPNPSFFSQFFKKNTGMTPKECREKENLTGINQFFRETWEV